MWCGVLCVVISNKKIIHNGIYKSITCTKIQCNRPGQCSCVISEKKETRMFEVKGVFEHLFGDYIRKGVKISKCDRVGF